MKWFFVERLLLYMTASQKRQARIKTIQYSRINRSVAPLLVQYGLDFDCHFLGVFPHRFGENLQNPNHQTTESQNSHFHFTAASITTTFRKFLERNHSGALSNRSAITNVWYWIARRLFPNSSSDVGPREGAACQTGKWHLRLEAAADHASRFGAANWFWEMARLGGVWNWHSRLIRGTLSTEDKWYIRVGFVAN